MTINRAKVYWKIVTFKPVLSVDKSKLFSNVQPTICQRKSSSSGERSLNLRLLKIIQHALKKIFKIAEWFQRNFLESALNLFVKYALRKMFKRLELLQKIFFQMCIRESFQNLHLRKVSKIASYLQRIFSKGVLMIIFKIYILEQVRNNQTTS